MAVTIAPWLKPTDTLGSMQAGSQAGSAVAQVRQRAQEAQLQHQASMARIASQNAANAARIQLGREQASQEAMARASQQELGRAGLAERARQFDAELESKANQPPSLQEWSGPVTLKDGRVVQVNRSTGDFRDVVAAAAPQGSPTSDREFYRTNPVMQSEEEGLLRGKAGGLSGQQLQEKFPNMFKYEPYRSKYVGLLGRQGEGGGQLSLDQLLGLRQEEDVANGVPDITGIPELAPPQQAAPTNAYYEWSNGTLRRVER